MSRRYRRTTTLLVVLFMVHNMLNDMYLDATVAVLASVMFIALTAALAMNQAQSLWNRLRNGLAVSYTHWIEDECVVREAEWWAAAAAFVVFAAGNRIECFWLLPLLLMLEERTNRANASYPRWRESYARWTEQRQPYYVPPKTRMDGATTCELDDIVDAR